MRFDPRSQESFGAYVLTTGRRTFGQDLPPGDVLLSRVLLALMYLAVLLVTLGPASRASRLPPAEAVRHAE